MVSRERVLKCLAAAEDPLTAGEVARELGEARPPVAGRLSTLNTEGKVDIVAGGGLSVAKYRISGAGSIYADTRGEG